MSLSQINNSTEGKKKKKNIYEAQSILFSYLKSETWVTVHRARLKKKKVLAQDDKDQGGREHA